MSYISFFCIILNQDIVHAHLRGSINSQSDGAMKRTTQGFYKECLLLKKIFSSPLPTFEIKLESKVRKT